MSRIIKAGGLLVGLLIMAGSATAGVILQDTGNAAYQIQFVEPMGQSFTAEDPFVKFAFYYHTFSPHFANAPLTIRLFAGTTVVGAPLISVVFSIPDPNQNVRAFVDVDLSAIELTVGNVYTASVDASNPYWGAAFQNSGNPYAGGLAISFGSQRANTDWRFRVTPVILDSDADGVNDDDDFCPATVMPEAGVPSNILLVNRWALTDGDFEFDTVNPKGKGPTRSYSTTDTAGCSCEQLVAAQGLGKGHTMFGCSIGAMDDWVELVTP